MQESNTAFVTGGGSGIGLAIVRTLLDEGWRVVAADLVPESLDQARHFLAGEAEGCTSNSSMSPMRRLSNVRSPGAMQSLGPLTGLVNSAGIAADVPCLETSTGLFRKILEVNVIGSFVASREAALRMREHGRGSIINIASVSGIRGNTGPVAYGSSKGGAIMMTKVMAAELGPLSIRVNAIAPGPIETPLVREVHTEQVRAEWMRTVPQRRYGTPEEIAGAATFLLDDRRSSYITGQIICVDGGFTAAGILGG